MRIARIVLPVFLLRGVLCGAFLSSPIVSVRAVSAIDFILLGFGLDFFCFDFLCLHADGSDKRVFLYHRYIFSYQLLDVFQVRQLFRFAKRKCNAIVAGTSGASDAVYVCFRDIGQLVVDDV